MNLSLNEKNKKEDTSENNNQQQAEYLDNNNSESIEDELNLNWISYKNPDLLLRYISQIYKISPRRFNGLTSMQQRTLKKQVSIARFLAILPYVPAKKK